MLIEKPKSLNTIGLQIEDGTLKAATLTLKKGEIVLSNLYKIDLQNSAEKEDVNPLYMMDEGKKILHQIKTQLSLTAISGSETLVRSLFVKLKKDADIDAVIDFQAEPILPFDPGDAVVDWTRVSTDEEGSELTIYGVKKEHISKHLESWERYQIDPECISTVPAAILAFCNHFTEDVPTYVFVHMGAKNTTCGLIHEEKLLSAQYVPKGVESITSALQKDLGLTAEEVRESITTFDFLNLDEEKHKNIYKALESLKLEMLKTFYALAKPLKGDEVNKLFITGEGAALNSLRDWLTTSLNMEGVGMVLPEEVAVTGAELTRSAVPVGLAISGLPKVQGQINLRKEELAHSNPLKRVMKPLALYFVSCLLVAIGIFLYGQASMGYQEDQLKEQFGDLLSFMNKPYDEFEKEYETKLGQYDGSIIPIERLNSTGLFDRIDYLEAEVDEAPQPIALLPNTPRVSDVLAWLSTHPNVVLGGDDTERRKSLIQIDNFNYSMVKRPEEKKRTNHYQVKVELEFTSTTPKLAREFHDALIEDNRMVDPKGEVKWSSNRGKYRTSFFLKDRTYYP